MTFKEYGTIVQENKNPSFKEYGSLVEEPSRAKSLINAPIKGAVKRAADITEFVTSVPGAKQLSKIPGPKELLGLGKEPKLIPEEVRQYAEESFPTQERELEKYLERAGGLGLESALSPGGLVAKGVQTLAGAGLGYASEKFGAPTWAQAIAESLPFFYSGGKKIPLKQSQKKMGEFLRNQGLTENEIAPLLKDPNQIERWSKFSSKGKKSKELMDSIYHKTGHIYDDIIQSGSNLPPISTELKANLNNEMRNIYRNMPDKYRKLIKQDIKDFYNSRGGIEDLINLDKDINAVIGAESGGKAIIGQFKNPIYKAIESISPEVASDYRLAKDLYRTRANVASKILTKKQIDDLMNLGEIFHLGSAIVNRDMGLLTKVIGISGGRKIAREMIINPRLQNKANRIAEALSNNKISLAEKYIREFKDIISEEDPDLAFELPD